jgi:hypothetical protein
LAHDSFQKRAVHQLSRLLRDARTASRSTLSSVSAATALNTTKQDEEMKKFLVEGCHKQFAENKAKESGVGEREKTNESQFELQISRTACPSFD